MKTRDLPEKRQFTSDETIVILSICIRCLKKNQEVTNAIEGNESKISPNIEQQLI